MKPIGLWSLPKMENPGLCSRTLKSYENMRNAIGILKLLSQGEEDVRRGKTKSQEEVFANIETILKEKMK